MPQTKMQTREERQNPEVCRKWLNITIRQKMAEQEILYVQDLARMMGMSPTVLSRKLSGDREWRFPELCRLVRVLDMDMDDLCRVFGVP